MDVLQTIVIATGCNHADIKLEPISKTRNGLGSTWVKCPVVAANKLIDNKKIRIGWTTAKITSLPDRGLQCFKCLQFGHVRAECRSTADRNTTCYRCGEEGHQARECTKVAKCLVCEEAGLPHGHRMGGNACHPEIGQRNKKRVQRNQLAGKQGGKPLETGPFTEHTEYTQNTQE
ncbi:PREDICTED: uncharacterized protein LOC108761274 [Trachymyrmex cornetzi]|uniref:uncharacterized protein LOC108761274 n=1 Tax=Trachymyrmex cornetzi TaxID=471704 RepID=UPI00084EF95A|nr:PREDICTED: uncharacterized protein LOC108761274 [Trachymyrmex cornetzi]